MAAKPLLTIFDAIPLFLQPVFDAFPFVLPDTGDQIRIAEIIRMTKTMIEARQQVLSSLDTRIKARFAERVAEIERDFLSFVVQRNINQINHSL